MKKHDNQNVQFPGFKIVTFDKFWVYPNFLEEFWCQMSGSEQKVLDFIMRQTIGFKKQKDRIALSQFTHGIGKTNKGTGLSKSQVQRAIKGLEGKGFITVTHYDHQPSSFSLKYEEILGSLSPEKFTNILSDFTFPLNSKKPGQNE